MRQPRPSRVVLVSACALGGGVLGGALSGASAQSAHVVGVESFDVQPDANGFASYEPPIARAR